MPRRRTMVAARSYGTLPYLDSARRSLRSVAWSVLAPMPLFLNQFSFKLSRLRENMETVRDRVPYRGCRNWYLRNSCCRKLNRSFPPVRGLRS